MNKSKFKVLKKMSNLVLYKLFPQIFKFTRPCLRQDVLIMIANCFYFKVCSQELQFMTLNKEFHLINPTNLEYILYNICSKLVGLIRWNSLFNVINYNIGLADKPWIPNWGEVRWNFIKFVKKGVEKRGKEA